MKGPKLGFKGIVINPAVFRVTLLTSCLVIGILLILNTGINLTLSFDEDYSRRSHALQLIEGGSFISYLSANYVKVIVPTIIALGLIRVRDTPLIIAGFFGGIVLFSIDGTKGSIFLPFAMIGVHFLLKYGKSRSLFLLYTVLVVVSGGYLLESLLGVDYINTYITRRTFFVPQFLLHSHISYFSEVGFIYFNDLPIVWQMVAEQREESAALQVGHSFLFSEGLNANVGIIQYGFSEAGILGCWLMSLSVLIIIYMFDKLTNFRNNSYVLTLSIPVAATITEQSLHTSILSGGLLGLSLMLYALSNCNLVATLRNSKDKAPIIYKLR